MFAPAVSPSGYHSRISAGFIDRPQPIIKTLDDKIRYFIVWIFQKITQFFRFIFCCPQPIKSQQVEALYRATYSMKNLHEQGQEIKPYWILALDGGGTRAMIPIQKLKMIEELVGEKIVNLFDLIIGSSTGGIMTGALGVPNPEDPTKTLYSIAEIQTRYMQDAGKIFTSSICHKISTLNGLIGAKYPSPAPVFNKLTGNTPIENCTATHIVITSVDISGKIVLFSNRSLNIESISELEKIGVVAGPPNTPLSDIIEATTGAPTYFPTKPIGEFNLADGGIPLNNPAEIATIIALNGAAKNRPIIVLSLGTGMDTQEPITSKESLNWGALQWVSPLIDYQLQFSAGSVDRSFELIDRIYPHISYIRLQDLLSDPDENRLDNADPANLIKLTNIGRQSFEHYLSHGGDAQLIQPLKERVKKLHA